MGVPQGSILGPVLYIIHVVDLPINFEECKVVGYADDTGMLLRSMFLVELCTLEKNVITKFMEWFSQQKLVMNPDKTALINFTNSRSNNQESMEIFMDDSVIEGVEAAKYLGLFIDKHLNWKAHVNYVCKKLSAGVFALRVLKDNVDSSTLRMEYFALFQSHLAYCIILWGNFSAGNITRVLTIQKNAIRVLTGLGSTDSCRVKFKELGILTVVGLYVFTILIYVKRNLNTL
jgi:hypothetical protein